MRVFVTGASGFVGSAIVEDLLKNGHEVLGLVRSAQGAEKVAAAGATPLEGDVNDPEILRKGIAGADAVIHTAFNHDFSKFKAGCEADRKVIETFGDILAGTGKPLVVTSGLGLLNLGRPATEDDAMPAGSDVIPRAASEEAAQVAAAKGVDVYIVRLPPSVHDTGDQGFIPIVIGMTRQNGESAYIGDGSNHWPAVKRQDAAALYRLIVEQRPNLKVLHAAGEEGIPFKDIATVIGEGLNLPVVSKSGDAAAAHFAWFLHFAQMNCIGSSEKTRAALGWEPKGENLLTDIAEAGYLAG